MHCIVKQSIAMVFILICVFAWASAERPSCNSCGEECADACGTRFFRTCCFNYLRKRSSPIMPPAEADFKENGLFSRSQIEQMLRNEIIRQENLNPYEHQQVHRENVAKSGRSPSVSIGNQLALPNGQDPLHVVYDI